MATETCSCHVPLFNYVLCNKVVLEYKFIYFINYWIHKGGCLAWRCRMNTYSLFPNDETVASNRSVRQIFIPFAWRWQRVQRQSPAQYFQHCSHVESSEQTDAYSSSILISKVNVNTNYQLVYCVSYRSPRFASQSLLKDSSQPISYMIRTYSRVTPSTVDLKPPVFS